MRLPFRRRTFAALLIVVLPVSGVALEGCSGDDGQVDLGTPDATPSFDGSSRTDATSMVDSSLDSAPTNDAGADSSDASSANDASDASPDAADAHDAADAADAQDAADAADAHDAADAAVPKPEKVSPAIGPLALQVAGDHVYWTESPITGAAPAVRVSPVSGSSTLPAAIYSAANGSLPVGIGVSVANNAVFYADNQAPNQYLWKMTLTGSDRTTWAGGSNGAGVTTNDTHVFFGDGDGVHRVSITTKNDTLILAGNMNGMVTNGPQSIAVDTNNVYAAPGGSKLVACPIASNCAADAGAMTTIAQEAEATSFYGIEAVASDGTFVFAIAGKRYQTGSPNPERLIRCPVTGCAGGVPVVLYETANPPTIGSHFGIAVDAKNVYWGSMTGKISYCAKDATAPCTPKTLVDNAMPFAMTINGPYLYWADGTNAIYRILRP